MKITSLLPLLAVLALAAGACQKEQSDEERNAEVEHQVQQRLATERQADEQQKLAARQAELDAREAALAAQENRPAATPTPVVTESFPTRATPSVADSDNGSYSTFYRKLEPYGDWMETGNYGYVFQPRQAAQSQTWRPYINGHWVYTDAGWTWISDEKFGWATYHYGRWVRLRSVGWVWVPGEEWAPAWVSWRKGGEYVGWAPLPPEAQFDRQTGIHTWADNYYDIGPEQYAFVSANEFGRKLSPREILPSEQNVTIINQTTNVTNIVYNNSVIVDRGPSYDDLRAQSRQPIQRYRLERTNDLNNEVPVFRGEVVALPTADFRPAHPSARPTRVLKTIAQPIVERGWVGIQNTQAAQKARAKMQAEATPPPNLPPKRFVRPEQRTAVPPPAAPVKVDRPVSPTIPATPLSAQSAAPSRTSPPPPAATATVRASATPTTPAAPVESIQPSPTENIYSPKAADRNRREQGRAAQEEKRKQRQQEQAERRQKMQGRRAEKQNRSENSPTATPEPTAATATASPSAAEAAATPTASSPTPTAPDEMSAAEKRRAKRAEKRAQRRQASPTPDASASPASDQP